LPRLPRRHRFAVVCLVASLGVIGGVIGYADDEEETIAGDPLTMEVILGCPDGYSESKWKVLLPPDKNGNGIVCISKSNKEDVIDDVIEDHSGKIAAGGHGNVIDKGKKIEQQDISFSFHGLQKGPAEKGGGAEAVGEFEFHDQTPGGQDLRVHGNVLCLSVFGNEATFVGQVTQSTDKALPLGARVVWLAQDNGEGVGDSPDRLSRPVAEAIKLPADAADPAEAEKEPPPSKLCSAKVKAPVLPILSGNIQVY
jgi:hypothetical protein